MTLADKFKRLARQTKKEGLSPDRLAPPSGRMRKVFFDEYERYQPRKKVAA